MISGLDVRELSRDYFMRNIASVMQVPVPTLSPMVGAKWQYPEEKCVSRVPRDKRRGARVSVSSK